MRVRSLYYILLFMAMFISTQANVEAEGSSSGDPSVADVLGDQSKNDGNSQQTSKENAVPVTTTTDTVWIFVKMILALAFVIALIYILLRFVNSKTKAAGDGRAVQNIGGVGVASNRSVQLVKVGDRILVVGVGDTVTLLKEIDEPKAVEQLAEESNIAPMDGTFKKLKDFIKNNGKKGKQPPFAKILENRLKTIREERKQAYENLSKEESDK